MKTVRIELTYPQLLALFHLANNSAQDIKDVLDGGGNVRSGKIAIEKLAEAMRKITSKNLKGEKK